MALIHHTSIYFGHIHVDTFSFIFCVHIKYICTIAKMTKSSKTIQQIKIHKNKQKHYIYSLFLKCIKEIAQMSVDARMGGAFVVNTILFCRKMSTPFLLRILTPERSRQILVISVYANHVS